MSRTFRPDAALAAILLGLLISPAALCDPWHKFAKQDAYWHHGSGWVFPRTVGAFVLQGSPAQIDGNEDLTSEYRMERNGARSTAFVDVYYPNSAAVGAKLDTARAASQPKCESSQSEGKVGVDMHPEIRGLKVVFEPKSTAECAGSVLYFFQTPQWVVTVRASGPADAALDEFVQALRWDSLGTDPYDHDVSP